MNRRKRSHPDMNEQNQKIVGPEKMKLLRGVRNVGTNVIKDKPGRKKHKTEGRTTEK